MKNINGFKKLKSEGKNISMVTCYDYWSAQIIDESDIDAVLVGDSAAMVMHGFDTTINATVDMMATHTSAVKRGLKNKFLISDLPFLAHKKGREKLIDSVDAIFKAGAEAIKIEGANGVLDDINYLVSSGIPVMGHIGLTPQSVHKFGGFTLQGESQSDAEKIIDEAKRLEDSGIFALVLEMLPSEISKTITESLTIPTIGIGAGKYTSGQILVLHDMLGLNKNFNPKFLKKYFTGYSSIKSALNNYNEEVKANVFPSEKESYN
ncbi:MAG: 3-methyl-2-oxobutanoate hydroxymethyltransferase [Melioribacteraceae bacterium]|nr:3-methyl-2-oxobutanoate hydroxymethyltransferase [Melioribacteraceae bacterium]